jgi:hypothetical protein
MDTGPIAQALSALFAELAEGAPEMAFMLNPGDAGLLRSLERLSAADASAAPPGGGATVAAHVEHVRYGLSLMNRWAAGENPFADADWSESWRHGAVTEEAWAARRAALADEARRWRASLAAGREVNDVELRGMIGSVAHLAYHLGAIRQIRHAAAGPPASD